MVDKLSVRVQAEDDAPPAGVQPHGLLGMVFPVAVIGENRNVAEFGPIVLPPFAALLDAVLVEVPDALEVASQYRGVRVAQVAAAVPPVRVAGTVLLKREILGMRVSVAVCPVLRVADHHASSRPLAQPVVRHMEQFERLFVKRMKLRQIVHSAVIHNGLVAVVHRLDDQVVSLRYDRAKRARPVPTNPETPLEEIIDAEQRTLAARFHPDPLPVRTHGLEGVRVVPNDGERVAARGDTERLYLQAVGAEPGLPGRSRFSDEYGPAPAVVRRLCDRQLCASGFLDMVLEFLSRFLSLPTRARVRDHDDRGRVPVSHKRKGRGVSANSPDCTGRVERPP